MTGCIPVDLYRILIIVCNDFHDFVIISNRGFQKVQEYRRNVFFFLGNTNDPGLLNNGYEIRYTVRSCSAVFLKICVRSRINVMPVLGTFQRNRWGFFPILRWEISHPLLTFFSGSFVSCFKNHIPGHLNPITDDCYHCTCKSKAGIYR